MNHTKFCKTFTMRGTAPSMEFPVRRGTAATLHELLGKRAEAVAFGMHLLRPAREEVVVVPFTEKGAIVLTHGPCTEPKTSSMPYVSNDVICNGADHCPLCKLGLPVERHLLLPVFSPLLNLVVALSMNTSRRPLALMPQIFRAIEAAKTHGPQMVAISKKSRSEYTVSRSRLKLAPTGDDERDLYPRWESVERHISNYWSGVGADRVSLSSAFISMTSVEMGRIPGVARALQSSNPKHEWRLSMRGK